MKTAWDRVKLLRAALVVVGLLVVAGARAEDAPWLKAPETKAGWKELEGKRVRVAGSLAGVRGNQANINDALSSWHFIATVSEEEGKLLSRLLQEARDKGQDARDLKAFAVWVEVEVTISGFKKVKDASIKKAETVSRKEGVERNTKLRKELK